MKKFILGLLAVGLVSGVSAETHAQSPFEFSYGYSLGIQNSFRNRLPAPPYFSVFPPVYYGQRYERPYGESPFASWPLLQPNPSYQPVRASNRVPAPMLIENPYCVEEVLYDADIEHAASVKEVPSTPSPEVVAKPKIVVPTPLVVHNPFVQELLVSK